jgi:SAM-dependent methyltransferase
LDIDRSSLDSLAQHAQEAGLADRIRVVHGSMARLDFPDNHFDVIWCEGAINAIGFATGLSSWRPALKPGGFLVVHEMVWLRPQPPREIGRYWKARYPGIDTVPGVLDQIPPCGYQLIDRFALPETAWWDVYYGPLEARVSTLLERHAGDAATVASLHQVRAEIDLYRRHQAWYGSAFFLMQKPAEAEALPRQ